MPVAWNGWVDPETVVCGLRTRNHPRTFKRAPGVPALMLVGAHVSAAGGVQNAPLNGVEIQCESIQLFSKNQRQWNAKPYDEETIAAFRANAAKAGYDKIVVHDTYLINLAAPKEDIHAKSVAAFEDEILRCHQLGIPYLNFHPGSHVQSGEEAGLEKIAASLGAIIDRHPEWPDVKLVIENTAGQGTNLGYTLEHVAYLMDTVGKKDRMGVCVDTQHTWASGYKIDDEDGYHEFWDGFDSLIGLEHLKAFHINDSKSECGSKVDRHDNLGEGHIGIGLFERLVNDPRFAGIPGCLETPGGPPMWEKEVARLKAMRGDDAPDRS